MDVISIDGKDYRLHPVKADKVKIGAVPVLNAKTVAEIVDSYEESLIISDWHKGCAIRLQAMARNCVTSGAITKTDFSRIASVLLTEDAARYQGNYSLLEEDVKAQFDNEKNDVETDENRVWEELL